MTPPKKACKYCQGFGWYITGTPVANTRKSCEVCHGTGLDPAQETKPSEREPMNLHWQTAPYPLWVRHAAEQIVRWWPDWPNDKIKPGDCALKVAQIIDAMSAGELPTPNREEEPKLKTIDEIAGQPPGSFSQFCKDHPEPESEIHAASCGQAGKTLEWDGHYEGDAKAGIVAHGIGGFVYHIFRTDDDVADYMLTIANPEGGVLPWGSDGFGDAGAIDVANKHHAAILAACAAAAREKEEENQRKNNVAIDILVERIKVLEEALEAFMTAKARLASDDFDCDQDTRQLFDFAASKARAALISTHPTSGEKKP